MAENSNLYVPFPIQQSNINNKLIMSLKNHSQVHLLTAIAFILALVLVPTANAADYYWNTTTTGLWSAGGNWSINSSALTVGTHTLTARQTDRAGNTSAPSPALVVTIEPEVLPLSAADLALDGYLGLSVDSEGILRFAVVDPADLASAAATPVTLTQGMASEEASSGSAIDLLLSPPAHAGSSLAMLC